MAGHSSQQLITTSSHLGSGKRLPRGLHRYPRLFGHLVEGQPIPLTPPMLAIAAAGDDAAGDDDAANEDTAAVNEAAGSAAEAPLVPHSTPVSPVREPTPEQQPVSQRPSSPSPTIPETEWVVPTPVSPVTDWRPWPYVSVHSPIRDHTPEPVSPPTPPAQTFIFEEPLVFGPEPRPAGYVDPDVIEPILFGPQPRPHGYVDPDFVEPIIFGPQPRPDNYLVPEDLDNVISMDDDTTHGGFHEESPVRPDDAPTPTADAAGRAEDPALLTSLSAKLDRCMGRIDSLETELGKSKKKNKWRGAILTLVSRVKKLEKTVKQLRDTRLVVDASAAKRDVDDVEEREEEEVPLRRKRSAYRRARTEFSTPAFEQFQATLSAGVLPPTAVPAEDAQARQRLAEEQASEQLVQRLRAEDLAQEDLQNVSEERTKELDDLMLRMTETDWLNLMMQVGSNPALAKELLGADDVKIYASKQLGEESSISGRRLEMDRSGGSSNPAGSSYFQWLVSAASNIVVVHLDATGYDILLFTTTAAMDSAGSRREIGVSPFADSAASSSPSNVSIDHIPIDVLFESTSGGILDFFLDSDEEEKIGMSRVVADPDSDDEVFAEIIFRGKSISGDGVVFVEKLPDDEIIDPRVKVETITESAVSPPRPRRKHIGVRSDDFLWDKPVEDFFSSESESDDDMENYIPPLPYGAFKDWEIFAFILMIWKKDFGVLQDEWIVSSWQLYPKSSVHVLDLTNGKTVYMFVDKVYPIRGNTAYVQSGFKACYECLAYAPIACTARQMVFSSPWLTAKKESGSSLQTALVCNSNPLIAGTALVKTFSNPLMVARLPKTGWFLCLYYCYLVTLLSAGICDVAGSFCSCCLQYSYLLTTWFLLLLNPLASRKSADLIYRRRLLVIAVKIAAVSLIELCLSMGVVFNMCISASCLQLQDVEIDDEDQARMLLTSLPSSYDNFVETLLYGRESLTLENVLSSLNSRELKKRTHAKDDGDGLYVRGSMHSKGYDNGDLLMVVSEERFLEWIMDSGGSFHMTPRRDFLFDFKEFNGGAVLLGNNRACVIMGIGMVRVQMKDGSNFVLENVSYIPELKRNLISLGTLDREGYTVKLQNGRVKVIKGSLMGLSRTMKGNCVYSLDGWAESGEASVRFIQERKKFIARLWINAWVTLVKQACMNWKKERVSFGRGQHMTEGVIDYVHADLWGPSRVESMSGCRYFLSIVDDYSRRVWVHFLRHKNEAFNKFKEWKQLVENQTGRKLKKLRTDNGLEFCNQEFNNLCKESGRGRHLTVAGTPQQNGLAERMNMTLLNKVRCLLIQSGLPDSFWAEATVTAAYLINRSPSTTLEKKTPMDLWSGHPANYETLKIFGCVAYSRVNQGKLKPRAIKCIFLGDTLKGAGAADFGKEVEFEVELQGSRVEPTVDPHTEENIGNEDEEQDEGPQQQNQDNYVLVHDKAKRTTTIPARYRDEGNVSLSRPSGSKVDDMTAYAVVIAEEEDTHDNHLQDIAIIPLKKDEWVGSCYEGRDEFFKEESLGAAFRNQTPGQKCKPFIWAATGFEEGNGTHNEFSRNSYDSCVYFKEFALRTAAINEFVMNEWCPARKILGMEISVSVPLGAHFKVSFKDCSSNDWDVERMSKVPYANAVGKNHWKAVKWILKYLKGTADVGLVYGRDQGKHVDVDGFMDANYAKDPDKGRSIIGYSEAVVYYGRVTEAVKESIWLKGLLIELGVNLREIMESKEIGVAKIGTKHNAVDAFTKVVPGPKFKYCMKIRGVEAN
ncbi:retrovirus-related pol polyprotein from transposon TNT 1-94 [Tanacetum coccineum]